MAETTAFIARFPAHFGGIWRDLAGIVAIGSCSSAADPLVRFLPLHEPIVVQFHCMIEIDFSSGEKTLFPICVFIKTQYEWSIDRELLTTANYQTSEHNETNAHWRIFFRLFCKM